jgi:hypothetical protein
MKFIQKLSLAAALFAVVFSSSCKKDEVLDPSIKSEIKIEFEHFFKNQKFKLNETYTATNPSQQMTFTTFKYYVSNVVIIKEDGSKEKIGGIFRLVDTKDGSSFFLDVKNIPQGEYTGIQYMIGIDSTTTSLGVQGGDLDPINGMVWNWNTGYIFLKAEGESPQAPDTGFKYHIGGFRDSNNSNAARTIEHSFGNAKLRVKEGAVPKVHVYVNVDVMFDGPGAVNIAERPVHMPPGAIAMQIADQYKKMFKFDHIHN